MSLNPTRPRILVDIDGVCADFASAALNTIEDITGRRFAHEDITTWEVSEALGLSPEEDALLRGAICSKGWCANLNLIEGAAEGIFRLREFADVYACTSPFDSDFWHREREQWCIDHLGFTRKQLIFTHAKYTCAGDFLIDDKVETLVKWSGLHAFGQPIVFDQPWNRDRIGGWRHISASGWPALTAIIETIWENQF